MQFKSVSFNQILQLKQVKIL